MPTAAETGTQHYVTNAPHMLTNERVPYKVVIPTLGRWRPAREVNPNERKLQKEFTRAFILVKTLHFLEQHAIPKERVWLFVTDKEEEQHYRAALQGSSWEGVHVVLGVRGIRAQRNFIVRYFPEGEYIVSIDDDVSDVFWKRHAGQHSRTLCPLPHGAFEAIIFDAWARMKAYKAFICGLNSTCQRNAMNMSIDGISTRNGEINGFLYFFINRHDEDLLPTVADATEDAERSLRYFRKDKVILRYRMYAGLTRCFQNLGGLQALFSSPNEAVQVANSRRKMQERDAAARLHSMFPSITGVPKEKKSISTLEITFLHCGGAVIPSTTPMHLAQNVLAERSAVSRKFRGAAGDSITSGPEEEEGKVAPQSPGLLDPGESLLESLLPRLLDQPKPEQPLLAEKGGRATPVGCSAGDSTDADDDDDDDAGNHSSDDVGSTLPSGDAGLVRPVRSPPRARGRTTRPVWAKEVLLELAREAEVDISLSAPTQVVRGEENVVDVPDDSSDETCIETERNRGTSYDAVAEEDEMLLRVFRRSVEETGSHHLSEAQVTEAILRSINGDVVDPVAAAISASEAAHQEELRADAEFRRQCEHAVKRSLTDLGPMAEPPVAKVQKLGAVGKLELELDPSALSFQASLLDMGFRLHLEAVLALLRDTGGRLELAVAILLSQDADMCDTAREPDTIL